MRQVVVVIGGGDLTDESVAAVHDGAVVIAADSGLDHAVAAGLSPTVLVGDLDSISAQGRMWAYAHGLRVEEHPMDKDETDTALALADAVEVAGEDGVDLLVVGEDGVGEDGVDLLVVGGPGDRLDHTLGTLTALGAPALARFASVRAVLGGVDIRVLHPGREVMIDQHPGTTFSLVALHGRCGGIGVTGARWPLDGASLAPGETVGISNETMSEEPTSISVVSGVLTVVIP